MSDNIQIFADKQVEVTPEIKEATEKGLASLREWLEKRHESGFFEYIPEIYEQAMQRLENAKVYFVQKGGSSILEAIEKGELHIVDRKLKRLGKDACMQEIKDMLSTSTTQGQVINGYIEEPVIIINLDNYKRQRDVTLDSLVLHEGTHALRMYDSESAARSITRFDVNEGVSYDQAYVDSGEEIYARLMQMRYHLKLDPEKKFSVEDVALMRQECMKIKDEKVDVARAFRGMKSGQAYSSEEMQKMIRESREKHKDEDKKRMLNMFNFRGIFERYSDEQIMNLLNETAYCDPTYSNDIDRDVLRADMQHDFALHCAKERVGGHVLATTNEGQTEAPKENTAKQTTITNEVLLGQLKDNQYT